LRYNGFQDRRHEADPDCKGINNKDLQQDENDPDFVLARRLAFCLQKDPRLTNLIDRWDTLPENIRRAVLALVGID
jgi:hypothetical protein